MLRNPIPYQYHCVLRQTHTILISLCAPAPHTIPCQRVLRHLNFSHILLSSFRFILINSHMKYTIFIKCDINITIRKQMLCKKLYKHIWNYEHILCLAAKFMCHSAPHCGTPYLHVLWHHTCQSVHWHPIPYHAKVCFGAPYHTMPKCAPSPHCGVTLDATVHIILLRYYSTVPGSISIHLHMTLSSQNRKSRVCCRRGGGDWREKCIHFNLGK